MQESNTLQHLKVMILDDMVYIVNVEELAEYVFLSLSSGQRLILLDLEKCPLKVLFVLSVFFFFFICFFYFLSLSYNCHFCLL